MLHIKHFACFAPILIDMSHLIGYNFAGHTIYNGMSHRALPIYQLSITIIIKQTSIKICINVHLRLRLSKPFPAEMRTKTLSTLISAPFYINGHDLWEPKKYVSM